MRDYQDMLPRYASKISGSLAKIVAESRARLIARYACACAYVCTRVRLRVTRVRTCRESF